MSNVLNRCAAVVLMAPMLAMAEPFTIISHATGTIPAATYNRALAQLGFDVAEVDGGPFELRLESVIDPDEFGVIVDSNGNPTDFSSAVELSLRIGDRVLPFKGDATASVSSYAGGYYTHSIRFQYDYYWTYLTLDLASPSFNGSDVLALRTLDSSNGLTGTFSILNFPTNPDAPGMWEFRTNASHVSLQVMSAVPEPAQSGLLCAGLLLLAAPIRRRIRLLDEKPA
jgi:hypothetical protein